MSVDARKGVIAAVITVVVLLSCWWLLRSEIDHGTLEARARAAAVMTDAEPADARAPQRREKAEPEATSENNEATASEPPPKLAPLTIRVVSDADDAPIAGAKVSVDFYEGDNRKTTESTTDAAGATVVNAFPRQDGPGVLVFAPGFVRRATEAPYGKKLGDDVVVVRLEPAVALVGVVVDAKSGAPLAGVHIVADSPDAGGMHCFGTPDPPYADIVTGADGAIRLDGIPKARETSGVVTAPRYVAQKFEWNSSKPRHVDLRLEPAGQIRGVVRDADGAPVENVRASVRKASDGEPCYGIEAFTNADGAFELDGLPLDDAYDVLAEEQWYDPTRASAPARGVRLTADAPAAVQDLVLLRAAKLEVHVRDGAGAPVVGTVWLQTVSISHGVRTDDAGDVELVVAQPGPCGVAVEAGGFALRAFEFDLAPGATKTMDVVMERGPGLAGVVVDGNGDPVAEARVVADTRRVVNWLKFPGMQETKSGPDGSFRLTGCVAAAYDLSVSAAGHDSAIVEDVVAPKEGLRIVLATAPEGEVSFALRGLPGGSHDVRVDLTFKPSDGAASFVEATEWNEGEQPNVTVRTGAYDVVLSVQGFAPVTRHVEIAAGGTSDLGEIAFERGVAVNGRVVDSQGRPVGGACVKALVGVERADYVAWSDAAGAFRLFRLPSSGVSLWVRADGFVASEVVYKPAPDAAPFVVTLVRGGTLTGHVLDPGRRHEDDDLVVRASAGEFGGDLVIVPVDEHGVFAVRLAPGAWTLDVCTRAVELATKNVVIREGEESPVELVLDK
jgi:hypothetical protein